MSKHTPGPWAIYPHGTQPGIDGEDSCFTVIVYGDEDEPDMGIQGRTSEERQANARLIAAAPDLLEALQLFLGEYVALVNSGDAGNWDAEDEEKVKKARAAIAKATGEQA